MHHKNIKYEIIKQTKKQLKNDFLHWHRLSKKEKKILVKQITDKVIKDYNFNDEIQTPVEDLLGISDQVNTKGIMSLTQMEEFIDSLHSSTLSGFDKVSKIKTNIKDKELKFVDKLLDNRVLEALLAYRGYSPNMREVMQSSFFRAELLKTLQYPEISYRKFCSEKFLGLAQKENREFIGLSLRSKTMISHSRLSQFRSQLSFAQIVNLLVYVLYHFKKDGHLGDYVIHEVDSTELDNNNKHPLHSFEINGQKIRIYIDLNSDCGTRRNKRNKSKYFIGYRLHTLKAIDTKTGMSFPLVSLIAAGNHHDSNFIKPLIKLAQAMGLELKLVTADEAYHDKDGSIYQETGVNVIKPASAKVKTPMNVDPETCCVTLDDLCDIPMAYLGHTDDEEHEYKCNASPGECMRYWECTKCRIIPFDNGIFQRIPIDNKLAEKAIKIRKNAERCFNLLKHREGLEQVRVRSQHSLIAQSAFATMATLLIEMAGTRKKEKKEPIEQLNIFDFAA